MKKYLVLAILSLFILPASLKKASDDEKPQWAKKDIRDFSDADMERLLEQWEEDDEPLPLDELPEYKRPPAPIDFSQVDSKNPENLLKVSKKGKTLMTFVAVSGNPTREETEQITSLWQSSLRNAHINAERYLVDDNRAIFMYNDGSQAWEANDFLLEQEQCASVTIENKVYEGKHSKKKVDSHVEL